MKVELTKEQLNILMQIINHSQITGEAAEVVVEIKKALQAPEK